MREPGDNATAPHARSLACPTPAPVPSNKDGEGSVPDDIGDHDDSASAASFESTDEAVSVPFANPMDVHPPAPDDNVTTHDTCVDPKDLWSQFPAVTAHDYHGYSRCPAE